MKITFKRTGGFAGMRLSHDIDTQSLPANEGQQLESLVESSGFFNLPSSLPSQEGRTDRFQYQISVETTTKSHSVDVGEAAVPASLLPLIDELARRSRSGG